jgi:hypothetical protein
MNPWKRILSRCRMNSKDRSSSFAQEAGYISAVVFLFSILFCGCAISRLPSEEQYEMIKSGKRAIVLLRLTSELEGEPYEPFSHFSAGDNFAFYLGGFETGGRPQHVALPAFLSDETRNNGWTYFVLEPGTFYFTVTPRAVRENVFDQFWPDYNPEYLNHLYRFDVPAEKIVYIGTLHLPGVPLGFQLFGKRLSAFTWEDAAVRNDEDKAEQIADQYFPAFGKPKTMLIQSHVGPKVFRTLPTIPSKDNLPSLGE